MGALARLRTQMVKRAAPSPSLPTSACSTVDVAPRASLTREDVTYEVFRKRHPAVRCWQRYTPEQRADHAAAWTLGPRQRQAFGEFYYTHPFLPGLGFPTAKAATTRAYESLPLRAAAPSRVEAEPASPHRREEPMTSKSNATTILRAQMQRLAPPHAPASARPLTPATSGPDPGQITLDALARVARAAGASPRARVAEATRYDPSFDPAETARRIEAVFRGSRTVIADVLLPRLLGRPAVVALRRRPSLEDLARVLIQPDGQVIVSGTLPDDVRAALHGLVGATKPALPDAALGAERRAPAKPGVDVHWLGTCDACLTPLRVTTRAVDAHDLTRGWGIVDGPLANTRAPWGGAEALAVTCPTCRALMTLRRIHGEKSHQPCNAACTFARGPLCECSCGGENHGIGFASLLLFSAAPPARDAEATR